MNKTKKSEFKLTPLPRDERQALDWLLPLLDLKHRDLRLVPDAVFKRAWYSIAFLYAGLHPDGALDHGRGISRNAIDHTPLIEVEPRLLKPYYERSGWPVSLAPFTEQSIAA